MRGVVSGFPSIDDLSEIKQADKMNIQHVAFSYDRTYILALTSGPRVRILPLVKHSKSFLFSPLSIRLSVVTRTHIFSCSFFVLQFQKLRFQFSVTWTLEVSNTKPLL